MKGTYTNVSNSVTGSVLHYNFDGSIIITCFES